jgi:hypothetical protein
MKTGKQKQPMTANPEMVALIAAILDPEEVRRTEPTNEIPNCLLAAESFPTRMALMVTSHGNKWFRIHGVSPRES